MPELPMDRPVLIEGEDPGHISQHFRGWRIEMIHLGRGPIRRSGVVLPLDDVNITGVRFGRAVILRGTSPKACCSLLSTSSASPPARVGSRSIGDDVCFAIGSEAQVDIYLPENCCAAMISVQPAPNGPGARSHAPCNAPVRGTAEFRSLGPEHRALLIYCIDLLESFRRAALPDVVGPKLQLRLRELLLPDVTSLFSQSTLLPLEDEQSPRRLAVSRACLYIDAHLRDPLTLNELCDIAGVRARTLEYGFREHYEVGPMSYLRSIRLGRVRNDLVNHRLVGGSVTETARRWRFTHMGQFGRDYRLLFGESPSVTLARSRELCLQQSGPIALQRE